MTYQEMCDCPEIQDKWEPKVGDEVWCKGIGPAVVIALEGFPGHETGRLILRHTPDSNEKFIRDRSECTHNPRGEDLWRMLPFKDQVAWELNRDWYEEENNFCMVRLDSNEYAPGKAKEEWKKEFWGNSAKEALIQGVMHELRGKKLEGERWV